MKLCLFMGRSKGEWRMDEVFLGGMRGLLGVSSKTKKEEIKQKTKNLTTSTPTKPNNPESHREPKKKKPNKKLKTKPHQHRPNPTTQGLTKNRKDQIPKKKLNKKLKTKPHQHQPNPTTQGLIETQKQPNTKQHRQRTSPKIRASTLHNPVPRKAQKKQLAGIKKNLKREKQ
ncbi:hypothetical protein KM043_001217 [Ampulex compressa]|nr:hypothetical protein KM043_001217 [Ampulex compressa]